MKRDDYVRTGSNRMTLSRSLSALVLAAGIVSAGAVAGAPQPIPTIPPTPPDVAAKMSALFARASLPVRQWVDAEARKLRPMARIDLGMVAADARRQFAAAAPPLTPAQADVLAAMALYQTAKDLESEARLRQPAGKGDMTTQDLLALQQLMERKNQLEQMISNVMRSSYEGGQAAVATLKAS